MTTMIGAALFPSPVFRKDPRQLQGRELMSSLRMKNKTFFLVVLLCLFFSMFLMSGRLQAQTYYVDAVTGNDNFSGTSPSNAWKTLKKVSSRTFQPGDQVLFKRGQVWYGGLTISGSGVENKPIVIGDFGDENEPMPIFDGTYGPPFRFNWALVRNNIYKTVQGPGLNDPNILFYNGEAKPSITTLRFNSVPPALRPGAVLLQLDGLYRNFWVTSRGGSLVSGITFFKIEPDKQIYVRQVENGRERQWPFTLGKPETVKDLSSLTEPGHWYWNPVDKAVYLYSDVPPAQIDIKIGLQNYGIRVSGSSFVTVKDIAVRGFNETGVMIYNCRNVTLENISVSGIGSGGHKSGILLFNSSNCSLLDSTVERVLGNAIVVYSFGHPSSAWSRSWNNLIARNHVHDIGSAGISLATDFPKQAQLIQNNVVEENTIERVNLYTYDAAGIYTLNTGAGNIFRANTIRDCGSQQLRSAGIMIDSGSGPTIVEHNIIENNSNGGVVVTDAGHRLQFNTIQNNGVSVWDCAQIVMFPVRANASNCFVEHNNIKAGPGQRLILKTRNPSLPEVASHFDYNDYVAEDPTPFCWSDSWQCTQWLDFYNWTNNFGFDIHSSLTKGDQEDK